MPDAERLIRWLSSEECRFWRAAHPKADASDWKALSETLGIEAEALQATMEPSKVAKPRFHSASFERPILWYLLGMGAIAATGGFLAGASSSPVISTILPLLFALVGGTGGIYLVSADFGVPGAAWRFKWLGRSLATFGISFLLFAVIGAIFRIGYDRTGNRAEVSDFAFSTAADGLQLATLRAKLDILNSSAGDQRAILKLAAQELRDLRTPISPQRVRELASQAKAVQDVLQVARKASPPPPEMNEQLTSLDNSLENLRSGAAVWQDVGMPRDIYIVYHSSVWFWLTQLQSRDKPDNIAWVKSSTLDRRPLATLLQNIHADSIKADMADWRLGQTAARNLDDFLSVAIKRPRDKREEFMPSIDMAPDEDKRSKETGDPDKETSKK